MAQALTSLLRAERANLAHIVKSLSLVGTKDLGVIYASPQEHALYRADVARSAARMSMQISTSQPALDLKSVGQKLAASSPAVQLFIGGTPELAQLTAGLEQQSRQRYVLALAAFQKRESIDAGGFRVSYNAAGRGSQFVMQSMLTKDGHTVG